MISVREAGASDAEALAEMRWSFRAGREAPSEDHDAFVTRCAAWMRSQLSTCEAWRAWVAVDESGIVGHVWLHTIDKVPNPNGDRERHAYLSNLYVKPAARGGVGTRLLEAAMDWASAAGVDSMVLWPTPRSRTLYARHGFTDRVDFLELKCR